VVLLGLTSMFTDVSSEMVNAVLPLYLTYELRLTPLQFGIIDGAFQGTLAVLRVGGGVVADRVRRFKEVAGLGYGVSAACKVGLIAAGGSWLGTSAVVFADRAGKGLRTAPRDALISLSSSPATLATSFGVHRALDTVGALGGPLVAYMLLSAVPDAFDALFSISFFVSLIGLGVLFLFVENPSPALERPAPAEDAWVRRVAGLVRVPGFARVVVAGTILGAATITDAFVYLTMQRHMDLSFGTFPLLYVGTASVYLLLAVPVGRLADRVGRHWVFLAGYLALLGVYGSLLGRPDGVLSAILTLALFGAFYAATDGVLVAMASALLPGDQRATGIAVLTTFTTVARFAGSIAFGLLWTQRGVSGAVGVFLVGLLVVLAVSLRVVPRTVEPA
jgi:hypothetical protein